MELTHWEKNKETIASKQTQAFSWEMNFLPDGDSSALGRISYIKRALL
jgi:hypothetical protein